ncbi:Ovarian-specific serine/threonine-protein kinase Lok [Frankliniella fusca]|uniref:Ovarian-specific serine/threonine-protein kinase Lok n=1 Tax=Frankliniella fusca TaxID=407009 RepID=A0AAE1HQ42_9NEOP|nr:Ovarian-specific serine/threonine-protein kinase Lok [Frankliniella fusca]
MDFDSQENTEPVEHTCDSQDSGFLESQQTQSQLEYWGRLYPMRSSLQKIGKYHCFSTIHLTKNSMKIGMKRFSRKTDSNIDATADVVLSRDNLPLEIFNRCSKIHFEIQRKEVPVLGVTTTQVRIIDHSSNGTYINGHLLKSNSGGSLRCKVLKTNDVIGFPDGKSMPNYDAYIFIDSSLSVSSQIPYTVRKKYQVTVRLGAGTFGEVSLVFDRETGKACAMKTIVKDVFTNNNKLDKYQKKLKNELDILQRVKHPNVIQLVDVLDCKNQHFLILEFMEGNDLEHRLEKVRREEGRLEENLIKLYFYQILQGVQYLHRNGIIHRDLKPANILLASTEKETILKITDFGLSKVLSPATMMKTLCGTKMYLAPEVIRGAGFYEYTEQVDVWSMGVILYLCLSGDEPFYADSGSIEEVITEGVVAMDSPDWSMVSDDAKTVISNLLVKDPNERIKLNEIYHTSWLQDQEMIDRANELYSVLDSSIDSSSSTMIVDSTLSFSMDESSVSGFPSPPSKKLRTL